MCRMLEVSTSGYYAWQCRDKSARANANDALLEQIKTVHKESRATYGSPRMHRELKDRGASVNTKSTTNEPLVSSIIGNYPNPFTTNTTIAFEVAEPTNVTIRVFNVLGQIVHNVVNQFYTKGRHEVSLDTSEYSPGIYFFETWIGNTRQISSMNKIK